MQNEHPLFTYRTQPFEVSSSTISGFGRSGWLVITSVPRRAHRSHSSIVRSRSLHSPPASRSCTAVSKSRRATQSKGSERDSSKYRKRARGRPRTVSPSNMEAWRTISRSLIGRPRRYLPGTMGPEMIARMSPRRGRPARTWSIVTYSQEWPASRIEPARYRGYGEMYGGTPKFDGSSTYPSRITTFMGCNPCPASDKRASPSAVVSRFGPTLLRSPATNQQNENHHYDGQNHRGHDIVAPRRRAPRRCRVDSRDLEPARHDR